MQCRIETGVDEDVSADGNESDYSDVLELSCEESDISFEGFESSFLPIRTLYCF